MMAQPSNNFDAWKTDPPGFFNRHHNLFTSIIHKHYFSGHLNEKKRKEATILIGQQMSSKPAVNSLKLFTGEASFIVYYLKILEKEIASFSQEEDLSLLKSAPKELILKYKPLVSFIISKVASRHKTVFEIKHDLEQEVLLSLFDKTGYIKKHYNHKMLFRNYIWSIIYYSLLNQLKSKKWNYTSIIGLDYVFELEDKAEDQDFIFCLYDGFRHLDHIMHSYGKQRAKLELCLKTVFSIPVSCNDLIALLADNAELLSKDELKKICRELNHKNQAAGYNQMERFAIIGPLLNKVFDTQSKSGSHLHWTNDQVHLVVNKLNNGGNRCFNRETFSILLELYFMKYYDSITSNSITNNVYNNKEAE